LNTRVVELVHQVEQTGQLLSPDDIRHEIKEMEGLSLSDSNVNSDSAVTWSSLSEGFSCQDWCQVK
jgi:hypothetical protein